MEDVEIVSSTDDGQRVIDPRVPLCQQADDGSKGHPLSGCLLSQPWPVDCCLSIEQRRLANAYVPDVHITHTVHTWPKQEAFVGESRDSPN